MPRVTNFGREGHRLQTSHDISMNDLTQLLKLKAMPDLQWF
jgi:hypothetical protein